MIGEWDVVEVLMRVVRIECSPPTTATLHSHNPFSRPLDRNADLACRCPIHCHHHNRGVVDIGVVRIGVLKGPAAGPDIRPTCRPITSEVEDLLGYEPLKRLPDRPADALLPNLEQGVAGQRSVPDRGYTGLAVRFIRVHHEELLD